MSAVPLLVMSAAAAAAAATGTLHSTEHYQVKYREWIEQYNVDMDPTDLEARLPIFAENRLVRSACVSYWSRWTCVAISISFWCVFGEKEG